MVGTTAVLADRGVYTVFDTAMVKTRRVEDIEIAMLFDGTFEVPLAGIVPGKDCEAVLPLLPNARIGDSAVRMPLSLVLLTVGGLNVLIDAGFGDTAGPETGKAAASGLQALGLAPEDVDLVLISHHHPDHIAGLRSSNGSPAFPNARILVPEIEHEFWSEMAERPRAAAFAGKTLDCLRRVFGPGDMTVECFRWGEELVPGVTALACPGHTPGHTIFQVAGGNQTVMILGDAVTLPSIFLPRPDWPFIYDIDADLASLQRRRLLDRIAQEEETVIGCHFPFPGFGFIERAGAGYRFRPD